MANYTNTSPKNNATRKNFNTPQPGRALPESPARFKPLPPLPGEEVSLKREGFNRKQFNDTVNTNFTQLGVFNGVDPSTFDPSLADVGDLFTIYQSLFFQIPKEGATNSHLFLIKESSQYLGYVAQQEEIAALTEEITELREQNLVLANDLATITSELTQAVADATNAANNI